MRGIWLTNVDSAVFNSPHQIREAIALIAATGCETVFPVVWNKGYTLYPSRVMREIFGGDWEIAPLYRQQSWDPLAEIIAASEKYNLKVIPWFEYGFTYTHNSWSDPSKFVWENKLLRKNWLAKDQKGNILEKNGFRWLNALDPEVQGFMLKLILEVVQNYPVAGIQGDDRLPAFPCEGGYDSNTQKAYCQATGNPPPTSPRFLPWRQWRADILTNFLTTLHRQLQQFNPNLILSLAPHPFDFGWREYLQDISRWLQLGIVDTLHPQLYRRHFPAYESLLQDTLKKLTADQLSRVFPGVLLKIGKYRLSPHMLKKIIHLHRRVGITGEVYFFYEGIRENNAELSKVLKKIYLEN